MVKHYNRFSLPALGSAFLRRMAGCNTNHDDEILAGATASIVNIFSSFVENTWEGWIRRTLDRTLSSLPISHWVDMLKEVSSACDHAESKLATVIQVISWTDVLLHIVYRRSLMCSSAASTRITSEAPFSLWELSKLPFALCKLRVSSSTNLSTHLFDISSFLDRTAALVDEVSLMQIGDGPGSDMIRFRKKYLSNRVVSLMDRTDLVLTNFKTKRGGEDSDYHTQGADNESQAGGVCVGRNSIHQTENPKLNEHEECKSENKADDVVSLDKDDGNCHAASALNSASCEGTESNKEQLRIVEQPTKKTHICVTTTKETKVGIVHDESIFPDGEMQGDVDSFRISKKASCHGDAKTATFEPKDIVVQEREDLLDGDETEEIVISNDDQADIHHHYQNTVTMEMSQGMNENNCDYSQEYDTTSDQTDFTASSEEDEKEKYLDEEGMVIIE